MLVGLVAVKPVKGILRELQRFGKVMRAAGGSPPESSAVASEVIPVLAMAAAAGHRFGPCRRCQRGASSLRVSAGRSAPISNCSRQSGLAARQLRRPRGYSREMGKWIIATCCFAPHQAQKALGLALNFILKRVVDTVVDQIKKPMSRAA